MRPDDQSLLALATAALAPFARAYDDLKFVAVPDLEVASKVYKQITEKGLGDET
jgi:hypothetical protein